MSDFINGLRSLSGLRIISCEASDFLHDAAEEMESLQSRIRELEGALKELEFYGTDPWARNKIRVALCNSMSKD